MTSPYVNYDAIRAMSDAELRRALAEDSMPVELYEALKAEQKRRAQLWARDARA